MSTGLHIGGVVPFTRQISLGMRSPDADRRRPLLFRAI
jgi:hypothetical protein